MYLWYGLLVAVMLTGLAHQLYFEKFCLAVAIAERRGNEQSSAATNNDVGTNAFMREQHFNLLTGKLSSEIDSALVKTARKLRLALYVLILLVILLISMRVWGEPVFCGSFTVS